jgi:hypothetical protein
MILHQEVSRLLHRLKLHDKWAATPSYGCALRLLGYPELETSKRELQRSKLVELVRPEQSKKKKQRVFRFTAQLDKQAISHLRAIKHGSV